MEPSSLETSDPRGNPVKSHATAVDLSDLESETINILQKFGSPGAKSAKRIGPPVSFLQQYGGPGPKGVASRSCRTAGGIAKAKKKAISVPRPSTSRSWKQVKAEGNEDVCRMFKADGTARNALRDTISSALSTSQFDTVPSLLASGKTNEVQSSNDGKASSRSSPFLQKSSSFMVSAMGVNKMPPKRPATAASSSIEDELDPSKLKSLSLRDVKYTGFDKSPGIDTTNIIEQTEPKENEAMSAGPEKEVCFNCWSAGEGNKCMIHTETPRSIASEPGHNLSMCKNWNTDYLRRKYRSEAIQEQFSQISNELVFDKSQKEFSTISEPKHPIYRLLTRHVSCMNLSYQRRQHVHIWFRSFIKRLKDGKYEGKRSSASARILLLKSTIKSMCAVRKLSSEVKDRHPMAPVTGTTMRERLGQEEVLVERATTIDGRVEKRNFVIAGPTPVPKALYRPRKYDPVPPTTYVLKDGTEDLNEHFDFSSVLSNSIQFATFGRKRANENIAVGGLSAQMLVSRRLTGRFPPQYKNFTRSHDLVLVPPSVDEGSPTAPTLEVPPGKLPYIHRPLVTPLDSRLPPAIMVKTGLRPEDRHFFGVNRPEQTGEGGDFGFRTSTWYPMPIIDVKINTQSFRPSEAVATPNVPVLSAMRKMKVDGTYPFRKEHSRTNCVEDLYQLLLSDGTCSSNELQMFTTISSQQCGYFMQNGDSSLPIGRVVTKTVRSWAFLQSKSEESAIYDEELAPLGLGGVVLKHRPRQVESMPGGVLMNNSRKDARKAILGKMKMPAEKDDSIEQSTDRVADKTQSTAVETARAVEKESGTDDSIISENESNTCDAPVSRNATNQSFSLDHGLDDPSFEQDVQTKQQDILETTVGKTEKEDTLVADSISHVIGETLKSFSSKPEDLIRLGMGIGASLGAQGFLNMGCAEQTATAQRLDGSSSISEVDISVPNPEIESEGKMAEIGGIDNITVKSCTSEESKSESPINENNNMVESNVVNFSDFNPSPQGLLNVIASTRVGAKRVEYLSYTYALNLPSPQNIEPLKPRSMALEWKEVSYNPWTCDRQPTSSTFVRSLALETKKWPKPNNRADGPQVSNTSKEFKSLCTLCRHGKYREVEEMINNPSWSLPIDYCDDSGNTLLMIACQNGNKRIAKLCLRRGSQINNQNLNGNSCLHFAFGYGFGELGDYLISKGADDSLQNGEGLTCYEFGCDSEL